MRGRECVDVDVDVDVVAEWSQRLRTLCISCEVTLWPRPRSAEFGQSAVGVGRLQSRQGGATTVLRPYQHSHAAAATAVAVELGLGLGAVAGPGLEG